MFGYILVLCVLYLLLCTLVSANLSPLPVHDNLQALSSVGTMMRDGPSRSGQSVGPNEAMVINQQQHISELVARNKTLEHTISKLKAAVEAENAHAHDAVAQIEARWKAERAEWREGCDSLQIAHRIAHLRTGDDLDRARGALLEAKEALRTERLLRMQRDFRLVMFQAKEIELEQRNATLERELAEAAVEKEELVEELDERAAETATALEQQCAELVEQLGEVTEEQARAVKEKEKAEVRLHHNGVQNIYHNAAQQCLLSTRRILQVYAPNGQPSSRPPSGPPRVSSACHCNTTP